MKDKKHIDRVFQERLKEFEATPSDAVWERIDNNLRRDTGGRKVIPMWWKIAGIAAGLALLLTLGNAFFKDVPAEGDIPSEVVDTNEGIDNSDVVTDKENETQVDNGTQDELINNQLVPQEAVSESGSNTSDEHQSKNEQTPLEKLLLDDNNVQDNAVADRNPKGNTNGPEQQKRLPNNDRPTNASVNSGVAQQTTEITAGKEVQDDIANKKAAVANNDIPQNLPELPTSKEQEPRESKAVELTPNVGNAVAGTTDPEVEELEEKTENTTEDASPTIEEALTSAEDGEDYDEKEEVKDRWSITPNVSPVYYNSLGNGSSIHQQFDNNSKSGQLNMSYGVNASYALTNRLSVRSGIKSVNVGYNTNDVVVYRSLTQTGGSALPMASSSTLRNIDLKDSAQGISVISGENLAFSQVPNVVAQNLDSSIEQEMSFVEVPVELEYKISDKKVGLSVIGGFSAMILNDNSVYTNVNDQRTLLGEANNINDISYSANLGVGLGVKVSEKIDLNFEPSFRYQIKTFNNASGDFKPYIIGVSSGLKFKF